jgi:uncharacterized Fe-S center protein
MCIQVCPRSAITIEKRRSSIDRELCIGCFSCMTICPAHAIEVDWSTEIPLFVERMVEYAYGAVLNKSGKVGYMNFLTKITPDCDCLPRSDAPVVPDIGILASRDPVSIDAPSFDLVNEEAGFIDSLLHTHSNQGKTNSVGSGSRPKGTVKFGMRRRSDWDAARMSSSKYRSKLV